MKQPSTLCIMYHIIVEIRKECNRIREMELIACKINNFILNRLS